MSGRISILVTDPSLEQVRILKERGINISALMEEALISYLRNHSDEDSKRLIETAFSKTRQKHGRIKRNVVKEITQ